MVEKDYLNNMTRQQAIDELRRLGVLIPFDDNLKLYHGRATKEDEGEWKVETNYKKSDIDLHFNVYSVPMFSVAAVEIASSYAIARTGKANENYVEKAMLSGEIKKNDNNVYKPFHPRVHRIISKYPNVNIINQELGNIPPKGKKIYYAALKKLADISPTSVVPVDFKDREDAALICKILNATKQKMSKDLVGVIEDEMVAVAKAVFEKQTGHTPNEKLFDDLVCVINTFNFLSHNPMDILNLYIANKTDVEFKDGRKKKKCPISQQAIRCYLDENNIIGSKCSISSNVILSKNNEFDVYFLYFLEKNKFNTETALLSERAEAHSMYFRIVARMKNLEFEIAKKLFDDNSVEILDKNDEVEFMKSMRSIGKMDEYMKAKAGVWEGYTVGEHTEAVLRIYNKYFADEMPENMQKIMRLAIFIHDLEKGIAGKDASPEVKQKERKEALSNLYANLGVSEYIARIAEFIAIDSQKFTTEYYIHKDNEVMYDFNHDCGNIISWSLNVSSQKPLRDAILRCCVIMQTCDSASYTSKWGIIRDEKTDTYYRGGNDKWNESFEPDADKPILIAPKENILDSPLTH